MPGSNTKIEILKSTHLVDMILSVVLRELSLAEISHRIHIIICIL